MKRASGILMHISSLPGPFGIGTFGQSAYDFVDFLHETKQRYWQILPLTTTSFGDSPYQSFSAFAGNTNFIDFHLLTDAGYLKESDYNHVNFGSNPEDVDYGLLFNVRRPILEKATDNFVHQGIHEQSEFKQFVEDNKDWLIPFAEYMTIKENNNLKPWHDWEDESLKHYKQQAVQAFINNNENRYHYHLITQFFFFKQWHRLKDYANKHNIEIIGDLPIYVARDSVEMWTTPELFKVDQHHNPLTVAGTPPDYFSEDGQYWGNPIYDWDYMEKDEYAWWVWRIEESLKLYDIIRIDHFRGFESFWEVPFGDATAANGKWSKGPSIKLFDRLEEALGELPLIAEDLGFMTQEVIDMREYTGFPGMAILQFGFTGHDDSTDLPHHYKNNLVAYVGTHDNETARGWWEDSADTRKRDQMTHYLSRQPGEAPAHALNRGLAASVADTVIYMMQDILNLNNTARMNEPNTIGINWRWRMLDNAITEDITERILDQTETYFRVHPEIAKASKKNK